MKLKRRVLFVILVSLFLINPGGVDAATETVMVYASAGDGQSGVGTDENQTTWYDARNYKGTVTYTLQDDQTTNAARADKVGDLYRLYRGSLPFDTSIIPESADILSASINLYAQESSGSVGGAKVCVTTHSRLNVENIVGNDYYLSNYGLTPLAIQKPLINYQYTSFDLDPSGLDYIDSDGYTVLSVRTDYDCDDIDPGVGIKSVNWYSSESEGTSFDPYLEITYEVPDEPEKEYPLYTQIISPNPSIASTTEWADDEMPCGTIAVCGCTISSLVSAADEYDFDADVLGQRPTPATINSYLKSIGGYNASGILNWLAASAYFGEFASDGTLTTRLQYPPKFISSDVSTEMQSALSSGDKIVLAFEELNSTSGEGHFVWVPKYSLGTYVVRDPIWYETKTADDEVINTQTQKDYGNDFDEARVYTVLDEPEPFSDTSIEVFVRGTAELLYENALGQKVGYEDGDVVIDLGRAEYGNINVIPSDEASTVSGGGKTLLIYEAGKEFTIDVVGIELGEYEMEFYSISKTGDITSFTFSGLTFPGVTTTFSFDLETGEVTEEPVTYEQFLLIMDIVLADLTPQQQKFFEKWAEKMFDAMETKTVSQALQTIETFGKLLVAKKVDSPTLLTVLERLSVE
ncbi:MAG: hypothetical protein KBC35_02040 [Candidatus Pacebacteria bacterium]|nr:hypothetical protein [Candidatus Paceibacterota bacterium]